MKIAILSDMHLGVRKSSEIFLDHQEMFFMDIFWPYIDDNKIDTIIDLGDIVEFRRYISYNVLERANKFFFEELEKRKIRLISLVGNHNTYYRSTNSLNALRALRYDKLYNIEVIEETTEMDFDGKKILMLPWINSENTERSLNAIKTTTASSVMAHLDLIGFEMSPGQPSTHGLDPSLFERFELVATGHYHIRSKKGPVAYLGSQYQTYWSDFGTDKGFSVLDTDTMELEHVKNENDIFHKIFYTDVGKTLSDIEAIDFSPLLGCYVKLVVEEKTQPNLYEFFRTRLEESNPAHLAIIEQDIMGDIENADTSSIKTDDTLSFLRTNVEALNVSCKDELIDYFTKIHNESLHSE